MMVTNTVTGDPGAAAARYSLVLDLLKMVAEPGQAIGAILAMAETEDEAGRGRYAAAASLLQIAADPDGCRGRLAQLAEAQKAHDALVADLTEREERVAGLEQALEGLADREVAVSEREADVARLGERLVSDTAALETRTREVGDRETAVQAREAALVKAETKIAAVQARLEKQEADSVAMRKRVEAALA